MMLRMVLVFLLVFLSSVLSWTWIYGNEENGNFEAKTFNKFWTAGLNRSRRQLMDIETRRMQRRMYVIRCCNRRSCNSYGRRKRPRTTTTASSTTTISEETTEETTVAEETTTEAAETTVAPVVTTVAPVATTVAPVATTVAPAATTVAPAPTCPVCGGAVTCVKDSTLFNANGLINPASYGQWANGQCGTFLVSTMTKSHPDAYAECCRLGMHLMSADSIPKIQCFGGAVQGRVAIGPGNAFWTSAVGCNSQYKWCPANAPVMMDGFASAWKGGAPTAVGPPGDCVSLTLQVPAMPGAIVSNVNCKNVQTYVCEGPVTPAPT